MPELRTREVEDLLVSKALNYGAGGYGLAFEVLDAKEAEDGKAAESENPATEGEN